MLHLKIYKAPLLLIILIIFGCQSNTWKREKNIKLTNKQELKNLSSGNHKKQKVSSMRLTMLRDTALSMGARTGLYHRAQQINSLLLKHEQNLNKVFNFYGMLLDDNVLPPILLEARKTLNLGANDAIRIAERNYQILHQARFVTAPPSWRDYIWLTFTAAEVPDKSLLPRDKAETVIWKQFIDEGWEAGINQANSIFKENLNRLVRDYNGMILYKKLLAQNMVSLPFVAKVNLGVTGNANSMNIDDQILRITAFPGLQTESTHWKTELKLNE